MMKAMKRLKYALIIILLAVVAPAIHAATVPALADSAYTHERWGEAIELYNNVLNEQGRSAAVYYNLGNAWYRKGNVAQAVLAYERALRIDPSHKEARANLDFVNNRLEDKPEDNNSIITSAHRSIVCAMSANSWAWIALLSFIILCGAVALYIFAGNVMLRKIGFFGGIALLIMSMYFIVVAHDAAKRINDHSEAIVTAPSTLLNSVPRQPRNTEKVVPLHEGTKVEIVDSIDTPDDPESPMWYNVRIGGGSASAWLRATDVERI